ncbi:DUF429 domain-containing protein [Clostridium faecium]|uniref:DUF429 domain-containing protein n=1 Tax=Clostridium faecium TaxID=2762223 RepID=A0ABR8YUN2_9CLOT|nr:DUF429 domain-containing protein [Clostridium faecium]MBD8047977.1 DUF429 domain-containing protein [Clostridium faecium]
MEIKVIGIDCATDPKKVGISLGKYYKGQMELIQTMIATGSQSMYKLICDYIGSENNVLLAIDAPLGWPIDLGASLVNHNAGDALNVDANDLFRRETDRFVKRVIGKQSLDVGADRIARTAHAALKMLQELRKMTGRDIKMTWEPNNLNGIGAIEVYPAATLDCYRIISTGYKDKNKQQIREQILNALKNHIKVPKDTELLLNNADALDSAICLLSAKDFIEGNAYYPEQLDLARKEGWIWIRNIHS